MSKRRSRRSESAVKGGFVGSLLQAKKPWRRSCLATSVQSPQRCRMTCCITFDRTRFTRPALWVRNLSSGQDRRLTDHNSQWQTEIAWPSLEQVNVKSGGVTVESWILKPAGATAPCPAVLYIHGGPHSAFGHGYYEDFHELVGAGYAVVFANQRGSGHYGEAFSTSIVDQWGHPEFDDFMAILDEMVDRKIIDPDRLGVMGVSDGGHLTSWLMTHTDRFKAAIPEQGVYSMISMYGVSDMGAELTVLELGGHPMSCLSVTGRCLQSHTLTNAGPLPCSFKGWAIFGARWSRSNSSMPSSKSTAARRNCFFWKTACI